MSAPPPVRAGLPARGTALAAVALAALALAAPAPARAQAVSRVRFIVLSADGGRHVLSVSATDTAGRPVPGLARRFSALVDGAQGTQLTVEAERTVHPAQDLYLVVDAALLRDESRWARPLRDAVSALSGVLSDDDRVRGIAAGPRTRELSSGARDVDELVSRMQATAPHGDTRLLRAMRTAAGEAARTAGSRGASLIVLTTGRDAEDFQGTRAVLTQARTPSRLVPVTVLQLAEGPDAREIGVLSRLCEETGGDYVSVDNEADLAPRMADAVRAARGRYLASFVVDGWDRHEPEHEVTLRVGDPPGAVIETHSYVTDEVSPTHLLQSGWFWLIVIVLLGGAVAAGLALRPRAKCLLVVHGGDDDGLWYEVFHLPVSIGSFEDNDIVLTAAGVSRSHAVLEASAREIELVDLNSGAGTFVNGERVDRRVLEDGDEIGFGAEARLFVEL